MGITQTLLEHGANPRLVASDGKTATQRAEDGNYVELSTILAGSTTARPKAEELDSPQSSKLNRERVSLENSARSQAQKEAAIEGSSVGKTASGGFLDSWDFRITW